jgi:hypothetical protein
VEETEQKSEKSAAASAHWERRPTTKSAASRIAHGQARMLNGHQTHFSCEPAAQRINPHDGRQRGVCHGLRCSHTRKDQFENNWLGSAARVGRAFVFHFGCHTNNEMISFPQRLRLSFRRRWDRKIYSCTEDVDYIHCRLLRAVRMPAHKCKQTRQQRDASCRKPTDFLLYSDEPSWRAICHL